MVTACDIRDVEQHLVSLKFTQLECTPDGPCRGGEDVYDAGRGEAPRRPAHCLLYPAWILLLSFRRSHDDEVDVRLTRPRLGCRRRERSRARVPEHHGRVREPIGQQEFDEGGRPAIFVSSHVASIKDSARRSRSLDSQPVSSLPKRFPDRVPVDAARAAAERLEPAPRQADLPPCRPRDGPSRPGKADVSRPRRPQREDPAPRPARVLADVELALGDLVGVSGRPAKTKRGEPSIAVEELELLGDERAAAARHVPRHRRPRSPLPAALPRPARCTRRRGRTSSLAPGSSPRFAATSIREGFVEVETPILQPRYGGAFAEPFVTHSNELEQDMYLRIATELYLKRLIVGGLERVYELGKDFRNESVSYKHQPEFTMLEWYEAYADYRDTMDRIEECLRTVAAEDTLGTTRRLLSRARDRPGTGVASRPVRRDARAARALDPRRGGAAGAAYGAWRRHEPRPRRGRSWSTTPSRTSWSRS